MASSISAGTTSSTALVATADTSGSLVLQTNNGTTALTLDTSQNATFAGYVNAPNTFGFKNRIINGAMMIDQRNAGASLSVTGAVYTVDRWRAQTPSGGTFQQITSTISGFAKSLKYTASASNSYMQMGQQIEYNNFYDCTGQTVIISFWAKANNSNAGSTALIARMRYGTTIDASVIFSGSNTDTSITISTTATKYSFTYSVPSNAGAISVEYVLGSHVSGDGFEITGVQLEKGSTATSFDYRPYGTELVLCQRYYETIAIGSTRQAPWTIAGASNITESLYFKVSKRASPTMGSQTVSGTNFNSGVTLTGNTDYVFSQLTQTASNGNYTYQSIFTASAEF